MRTDGNHIALERTRSALNLFRQSKVWNKNPDGGLEELEVSLISRLKLLQQNLRINSSAPLDPIDLLNPFLAILKTPHLANSYKSAALDAIRTFIMSDMLSDLPERTGDALAEVVEAVTRCKYVLTELSNDEFLQLEIINVLHCVVRWPVRALMTDETAWNIVESCHAVILHTTRTARPHLALHIEQILLDSVRFIFECTTPTPSGESSYRTRGVCMRASFGLPCAMKALGFFVKKLQRHAAEVSASRHKSSTGGEPGTDADVSELLLSLKAIHAMILAGMKISPVFSSQSFSLLSPLSSSFYGKELTYCFSSISLYFSLHKCHLQRGIYRNLGK